MGTFSQRWPQRRPAKLHFSWTDAAGQPPVHSPLPKNFLRICRPPFVSNDKTISHQDKCFRLSSSILGSFFTISNPFSFDVPPIYEYLISRRIISGNFVMKRFQYFGDAAAAGSTFLIRTEKRLPFCWTNGRNSTSAARVDFNLPNENVNFMKNNWLRQWILSARFRFELKEGVFCRETWSEISDDTKQNLIVYVFKQKWEHY